MNLTLETQNKIALGILCTSFGISVGILADQIMHGGITYDREVNFEFDIVGVLTLLATIVIVVVLERNNSKKDHASLAQKNSLTKSIERIDFDFSEKIKDLARGGKELLYINQVLKRHRMRAYKIIELAKKHNLIYKDSPSAKGILERIKSIQDLMTDTPMDTDVVEDGVRLEDGKIFFSQRRTSEIVSEIFDFNSSVFELIAEVNSN